MLYVVMNRTRRTTLVLAAVLISALSVAAVHAASARAFNYPDYWSCGLQSGQWCAQDEAQHNWTFSVNQWLYGQQHGLVLSQDCDEAFNGVGKYAGGSCIANVAAMGANFVSGSNTVWIGESGWPAWLNASAE